MSQARKRWAVATLLALVTGAGALWLLWARCGIRGCPDVGRLDAFVVDAGARVLDRHGVELARLHRVPYPIVSLDSLPPHVPAAFVAIEDQRFWEHGGIDWSRVAGAMMTNLRSRRIRQGFSTITMQLARNAFPDRLPYQDRTVGRKFAEMRVARTIEARYDKRQILELYLNHIYFGGAAWGIEAASREYFSKPASSLTLAEAAMLAGMIASPNELNPRLQPVLAYQRRWVVLHMMWRAGMITQAQADSASNAPLTTSESMAVAGERAPYFVDAVRRILERELGPALYTNGFTVRTTLDARLHDAATEELRAALEAIEGGKLGAFEPDTTGKNPLQGAVVVLEAATGDVLALVGGRDFSESRYNRALLARRQMASTIKPFIYAAALEAGYSPAHRLNDLPFRRDLGGGRVWAPRNYEDRYSPAISMRDALVHSSNAATIRLAEEVGLDRVAELAQRMGLVGPFPRVPALALGAAEASLIELAAAYTTFATLGRRSEPRIVTRVEDRRGRLVWRRAVRAHEALEPHIAFMVTDMMRDVVDRGTGRGVRAVGFVGPAAGKTGTAHNATDAWFIGFTPSRVGAIWIGHDMPRPIMPDGSGERLAAPVWGRIMRRGASVGEPPWPPPPRIETRRVDALGRVFGANCAVEGPVRTEYFTAGTAPSTACGAPAPRASGAAAPDTAALRADSIVIPAGQRDPP